jgi:hypothetical protein
MPPKHNASGYQCQADGYAKHTIDHRTATSAAAEYAALIGAPKTVTVMVVNGKQKWSVEVYAEYTGDSRRICYWSGLQHEL